MTEEVDGISKMKRQVGWFVILGLSALIFVVVMVSVRSNIFADKFTLFVEPPSASSFYEGQPVKFQGFSIGNIDDIQLQHEGQVRIRLKLLGRYRHMLHQGAIIHFVKKSLIGEQILEITAGDVERKPLKDGQLLQYETEASLEQLLIDLKPAVSNANVFLEQLTKLSLWFNDPKGSLQASMKNLEGMTRGIQGEDVAATVKTLQKMIQGLDQVIVSMHQEKIITHVKATLVSSEKVMNDLQPLSQSLGEQAPKALQQLQVLLKQVNQLSEELTVVSSDLTQLTPELPGVARETKATLEEMKLTLQKLQHSWLLGGGKAPKSVVDSVEIAPPVLEIQP
ncbi:MAG: MlaD family protein [Mariprofundaceae bacterium]|nr:MlaD family protein [Mariprofundaceae bacterium]